MKDTIIKGSVKRRELIYFIISLTIAFILNIYSIIRYDTEWIEIFSSLHIVLLLSVIIYVLIGILRLLIMGIRKLINK
jgi:hypothetical protein